MANRKKVIPNSLKTLNRSRRTLLKEKESDPVALAPTVVTGTRLVQGDPTARVLTITAEDIAKRGVGSVEDIIRTIPQIFSSINGTNNMNFGSEAIDRNLGPLAVGISTANLRGFRFRPIPWSCLTGIALPARQVKRISSSTCATCLPERSSALKSIWTAGSSVYGSDGVAGVINIITRKGFTGGKVSVRNEQSSNGADQTQLSGYFGYNWESGGISANLSRTESESYSASKAGYYTKDWKLPCFGGDQAYNFNVSSFTGLPIHTRSARIGTSRWGPFNLVLPEGNDGRKTRSRRIFRLVTAADAI